MRSTGIAFCVICAALVVACILPAAAGDTVGMHEINDEMEALQRKLHRQGFGRVPVDDLLEPIADRLPEPATGLDLDEIEHVE